MNDDIYLIVCVKCYLTQALCARIITAGIIYYCFIAK
jgi:hypothetical protein